MEFFFDFISPYAYFASTQIDALAKRYGREVQWKPVLIGVTVMQVMGLKPLMETPLKSDYVAHDKPRMARLLGIPFVEHGIRGVNSVAASRAFLAIARSDEALAQRFARAVFERLWVRGMDITAPADVGEVCAQVGADAAGVLAEIASPAGKQALRDAVDQAVARGVFGTPYFFVDGEPIWGVDRLWMVEHWLIHGNWDPAAPR